MNDKLARLQAAVQGILGEMAIAVAVRLDEVTVEVAASDLSTAALRLRDNPALRFEQLIDLSGVDYEGFAERERAGPRFASVIHLLSIEHNWRLRMRVFAPDDGFPVLDSLTAVWPNADWYERESFDLYGIVYSGHADLRRILTDYGFVGHPFRKDFPLSGHVEMRYDPEQKRVVYQPVSIEPREVTPRIVREETYAGGPARG